MRTCATGNFSHPRALLPTCLRSWTRVNFVGMPAWPMLRVASVLISRQHPRQCQQSCHRCIGGLWEPGLKLEVMQPKIKQRNSNFQHVNKLYWISSYEVLQSWLMKYSLSFKTDRGEGEGLKREEALKLITSFYCKGGGRLVWEGGFNRWFKLCF